MTEMTREVPKKPTNLHEFWPADGKLDYRNKEGYWLRYRSVTIGPFPNKNEMSWYDGQVQDVIHGWNQREYFAGRVFQFGDAWYVERWDDNDGPFMEREKANEYRHFLYEKYNENGERLRVEQLGMKPGVLKVGPAESGDNLGDEVRRQLMANTISAEDLAEATKKSGGIFKEASDDLDLMQKAGYAVRGGMKWGKLSETGRVQVTEDGKVKISDRQSEKPKKTTDDIMDVSHDNIRAFIEGVEIGGKSVNIPDDEATKNYCGYVVNDFHGLVHIDPVTRKIHQNNHICNQQCRDLAARARSEYAADVCRMSGGNSSDEEQQLELTISS